VSTYLYKGQQILEQSDRNLGFIKQLVFIALHLDIFTSVKSRDLNYTQCQHTLWIGTKGYYNSISYERIRNTSGKGKGHLFQAI